MKNLKSIGIIFLVGTIFSFSCVKDDTEVITKEKLQDLILENQLRIIKEVKFKLLEKIELQRLEFKKKNDFLLILHPESDQNQADVVLKKHASLLNAYITRFGKIDFNAFMINLPYLINPKIKLYRETKHLGSRNGGTPCFNAFEGAYMATTYGAAACMLGSAETAVGPFLCAASYAAYTYYLILEFEECCGC